MPEAKRPDNHRLPARLGTYEIGEGFAVPGGGFDALAKDTVSGKEVRLWIGAPTEESAGAVLAALDDRVRTLSRLYHPSIPRVLGAEVLDGRPVLRFQPYQGRLLRDFAANPDPRAALDLARTVGAALAKAHGKGLVHGALGEEEILITADARPLLLHVGFAPFLDARPPRAPEDRDGGKGSESGDVYGLARLFARMLLGEDPGAGEAGAARRASEYPETLPEGLRRFLERALQSSPAARMTRAEEFAADLSVIRASWDTWASRSTAPAAPDPARNLLRWIAWGGVALAAMTALFLFGKGC